MFRRLSPAQLTVDIGLAVVCVLLRWTMREFLPLWFVVLTMATALALRRLSPGVALVIAWVGAIASMVIMRAPDVSALAILAVLYTTARYGGRVVRWLGLASAIVGAVVATLYVVLIIGGPEVREEPALLLRNGSVTLLAAVAVLGLSWTLGLLARTWANARESRRGRLDAERAIVVEQERNRIARDMHDVVAHSLAVVIAQADGARYAKGVKAKDEALATIASTGRDALADVRLLLGQLRHSEEAGPQPALADLEPLVQQLRASGLPVHLEQHGTPHDLPAGQQLALYRIVQEALTNALRHGSGGARLDLEWAVDAVTATIANPAVAAGGAASTTGDTATAGGGTEGHGIAGMRERAILAGGTLEAGGADGEFVVTARIPVAA